MCSGRPGFLENALLLSLSIAFAQARLPISIPTDTGRQYPGTEKPCNHVKKFNSIEIPHLSLIKITAAAATGSGEKNENFRFFPAKWFMRQ